jgi:hypothetical protein
MVPHGPAQGQRRIRVEVHLRPPSLSHGFTSFLWAFGMGLYLWVFLAAVEVSAGTAFLLALVLGIGIFFFVLLLGSRDRFRA